MARTKCPRTGKVQYAGPLRAAEALGRAKRRAAMFDEVPPVRYYRCNMCKRYHLTKQEQKTDPVVH